MCSVNVIRRQCASDRVQTASAALNCQMGALQSSNSDHYSLPLTQEPRSHTRQVCLLLLLSLFVKHIQHSPISPVFGDTWTSSFCTWVITELSIWQSRSPQNPQILSPSTDGHPSLGFIGKSTQLFTEVRFTCHPPHLQSSTTTGAVTLSCSWVSFIPRRRFSFFFSRRSAWGGGKALGYVFRRVSERLSHSVVSLISLVVVLMSASSPPLPSLRSLHFCTYNMENPGERRKTTEEMGQGRPVSSPPLLQINNIARKAWWSDGKRRVSVAGAGLDAENVIVERT